jgi:hypothetical protein
MKLLYAVSLTGGSRPEVAVPDIPGDVSNVLNRTFLNPSRLGTLRPTICHSRYFWGTGTMYCQQSFMLNRVSSTHNIDNHLTLVHFASKMSVMILGVY